FQAQIDQLLVTKLTRQPKSFEKILIAMSREPIDEGDATASNIRQAIYHKLTTDVKFYSLVENYSKDKLNKIGLGDAKNLNNIYNIIDSLLFLIDDPERFIQGLTADEIREYFNIEEKQVDIEALRTALLSLVALRKFHYLIASGGIKLKPLFRGEKGQQTLKSNPTHIIQVREVIKTADQRGIKEDLIVALNVNEQNIQENKKLSLSQRRLFQLRRRAWVELVAPLNYDQQLALYELYGVFFDIKTLPVPETFIFTELVAQSNLANQYYDLVDRDESLVDQDESLADQDGMTQVAPQFRKAFANQQIRKKIANNAYKALGGAIVKAVPKAAVIEKALKAMGLGKTVDDLEEKLGKAAVIAGAVITAALGGLIALIKQSLWGGLIGGAIGGVAGFVLGAGNPLIFIQSAMVGSAIGSSIGAWISKSGGAGNVFKGLFNQGTAPALQTTLGGSVGGGGLASAIPTSFPIAAIAPTAIITSTALTAVVISQTASSSLRPVMEPDIMTGQQNISQYVDIDKKTSISYLENNQPTTVTYSITITPKNSYVIGMIPDETKDVWSYLGDNPLNLPDQTEKIIEQIGIEPITSPIIISYAVEISGEDIAINNNFTFAFEVLDESGSVTDSVAAFASITIGKPDIGCFVPGEAGFSIGSGDYQLQSVAWTPEQWNRLIGLFSYRAGTSINFTKLICQSGELKIYRLPHGEFEDGGGYGGWAFSAGAIGIYDYGLSFTNASLEYTLIHELGHTLDYRNSGLRTDFLTHLHNTSCFTYPFPTKCSSDNEKSGGYEAFAEGTALYVVYQTYNFSGGKYNFKANDSDEYNWFKNNVFEIEF
ncbi:hypothetical protein KJ628_01800, partial [Patescibacteria group bacterium]|nr:hypothetical protein [Patescibacteria group bacterium]